MNIKEKLEDLHKQATHERSHYYVGSVVRESIDCITRMQYEIDEMRETIMELETQNQELTAKILDILPDQP